MRASQRVSDTVVAIVDDAVAGFVMVVDDEVEQVYVSAHHRGTGVAAVLLAEAERRVVVNGHERAWLAVVAGNARARRFYERNGWTDEGVFDYPAASAAGPIPVPSHRYVKLRKTSGRAPRTLGLFMTQALAYGGEIGQAVVHRSTARNDRIARRMASRSAVAREGRHSAARCLHRPLARCEACATLWTGEGDLDC